MRYFSDYIDWKFEYVYNRDVRKLYCDLYWGISKKEFYNESKIR